MNKLQRYIFLSLLTAFALVLSIIESMIPLPYIAPGAKLGLSNIVILSVIIVFGFKDALLLVVVRSILLMLVATNPITFTYSITSGIMSTIIMTLSYKYFNKFSLIGTSVLGALTHNATQISVGALYFQTLSIFYYFPILSIVSIFTGCFVGYTTIYITENLFKNFNKLRREV